MKRNEEELKLVEEIFDELIARVSNFSDDDLNLLTCGEAATTNAADHVRRAALKADCEYRRRGESTPPHVASAISYQPSERAVQSLATISLAVDEPRSTEEVERGDSGKRAEDTVDLHFRNIADTMPVMIWVCDANKKSTYFNRLWLDFTGRSMGQELGEGWTAGVFKEDVARRRDVFNTSFDNKKRFEMEYRLQRFDGAYRWILECATPRFATDGMFLGYIGSCTDITERKQSEEALREVQEALREAREEVKEYVPGSPLLTRRRVSLDKRVEKIIQMMREDLRGELSLGEFAQSVNLSVWRLCHIFKSDVGMPPIRYLRLLRMERAKHLLESSFLSVKEIAYQVGLNDEGNFVRDFKSTYGSSPALYRSHSRRSAGEQRPAAEFEGIEARNSETIW